MKDLKTYSKENIEDITESLLLTAGIVCLACLFSHALFKVLAKSTNELDDTFNKFWNFTFGRRFDKTEISDSLHNDELTISEKQVSVKDIHPMQITSKEILKAIVDTSNPKAPTKDKGGKGLYLFDELLKRDSAFANIGEKPYAPIYAAFMSNDGGKDPKSTVFYGVTGFTTNFFIKKNKAVAGLDPKVLKTLKKAVHIILWQTDPMYAKLGLAKNYVETLKKCAKELHSPAITIQKGDDKTNEVYKSLGFIEKEELKDYLILPLKADKK